MYRRTSRLMGLVGSLLCLSAVPAGAHAQAVWPTARPITLIVPYSAGGSVDYNARLVAQHLAERLKQSITVENTTGAGGAIGLAKAAKAAPDGYTLVAGPDSGIAIGQLVNPAAYKSFDPIKDLVPVGLINTAPMVLVARPGLPAQDFAGFVKLAKAQPGQLSYATSGVGTVLQLAMELLKQRTQTDVTHVPYRGGAQIATDLIGNQVDSAMLVSTSVIPHVRESRLKALGITGEQRLPSLPQVPTFNEMPGLKGYSMVSWTGLFAPKGTPEAVVQRLNRELDAVLADPQVRAKLDEQGAVPGKGSAQEFARFVQGEYARNQKIVSSANIKE